MIIVQEVLISDEIINEEFVCNLNKCKGACCWEGDYGAPITENEDDNIKTHLEEILEYLPERSVKYFENHNPTSDLFSDKQFLGTALHSDGACVYLNRDEGIAKCGIQEAYNDGKIPFNKPISCYLYPIRIDKNEATDYEAWNYDQWSICSDACTLGKNLKVPIYKFLKEPIIAYKGEEFYEELEAVAAYMQNKEND